MSASSKKKLRKEQNQVAMTQRQKKEQQEARKLKAYTLTFAIIMVLVVSIVFGAAVTPVIEGIVHRNSTTVKIGDHKLSATDLNYFYMDAITEHQEMVYDQYYSSFGDYWSLLLGFDATKPLNEQQYNQDADKTWADYFIDNAINTAKDMYALYDDAMKNGFTLTETERASLDSYFANLDLYAAYYGYSSAKSYLRQMYGNGANVATYREYYELCTIATAYLNKHADSLEYNPEDYRAYEADKFDDYSTVSYVHYTMKYNSYLGEGTKSEDGKTTTWSEEEKAAAREAMKADMEALLAAGVTDKESFDKAIQAWEINKIDKDEAKDEADKESNNSTTTGSSNTTTLPSATEVKNAFFDNITLHAAALEWLQEKERTAGEIKAFDVVTYTEEAKDDHVHSDECECAKTIDGYTIVLFTKRDDNHTKLANVRHILVKFEGGTTDKSGNVTYSQDEKDTAKAKAEALLEQWKNNNPTEESFADLANKESDDQDGKVTNGGLYEDIYPGQMVQAFEEWCFDPERQPGNTGIVETEYGYHVMFYSSADEMSYRDKMIDEDLRVEDTEKWHKELVANMPFEQYSLKLMALDYIAQK